MKRPKRDDVKNLVRTTRQECPEPLHITVIRGFRLSEADTADVFQATWFRLVEQLGSIRDGDGLGGWLATTARRE